MVRCSVLGCKSDGERKITGLSFHSFPTNQNLREIWIAATGRNGWKPTKTSKICSNHFDPAMLSKRFSKTYINFDAVPTKSTGSRTLEDSLTSTSEMEIDNSRDPDTSESMVPIAEMISVETKICESENCPPELEEMTIEPLRERKRELYLTIKPPEPSSSKVARIEQVCSLVNEPKTSPNLNERNKEEKTNELDIFGQYVVLQLKSLYEEDAILAQDEIQSILTRYKLKKVRQKSDNFMQSSNAFTPESYTSE